MNTTWFEKGIERGRTQERLEIARELLKTRFGSLSAKSVARLQAFSAEQLSELIKQIIKANSLRELGLEE
jgi:hypothetical protein